MAVDPYLVMDSIVAKLKAIDGVIDLVPPDAIYVYKDGYPSSTRLANAIHDAPTPSILVYYRGLTPTQGTRESVTHLFSLAIKGLDEGPTYGAIFTAIMNGVLNGKLLRYTDLHPGITPMNSYPYVFRTNVITDLSTGEYIEYFEVQLSANER